MYINRRAVEQQMKEWKKRSGLGNLRKVMYKIHGNTVNVYCSRPGYLIGGGGKLIREYEAKMRVHGVQDIKIIEVEDSLI